MKRPMILLLVGILFLTCSACGENEKNAQSEEPSPSSISQQSEPLPMDQPPSEPEATISPRVSSSLSPSQGDNSTRDIQALQGTASASKEDKKKHSVEKTQPDSGKEAPAAVDLDLTTLSSTMVYGEVFNMMSTPDDYIGKIIRLNGLFTVYQEPETGQVYCGVIVQDAAACCAQGFDVVMPDHFRYPDDYPPTQSEVTIVATIQADRTLEYLGILTLRLEDITFEHIGTAP